MKTKKKKSLSETEYLLSSPANAKRLIDSIKQGKSATKKKVTSLKKKL